MTTAATTAFGQTLKQTIWNRKTSSFWGGSIIKNTPIISAPPPPLLKITPLPIITGAISEDHFLVLKTEFSRINSVKKSCMKEIWQGQRQWTNSFKYFVVISHYFAIFIFVKEVAAKTQRKRDWEFESLRGCEAGIFLASRFFKFLPFKVGWIKRSESTFPGNIVGGFGVKPNALIHPTHKFMRLLYAHRINCKMW